MNIWLAGTFNIINSYYNYYKNRINTEIDKKHGLKAGILHIQRLKKFISTRWKCDRLEQRELLDSRHNIFKIAVFLQGM